MENLLEELNKQLFLFINTNTGVNYNLDLAAIIIADYTAYLFLFIMLYTWFTNRKYETLYAGYAASLGLLINQIIGLFYYHNRPFVDGLGINILSHNVENSFPSDHTTLLISITIIFMSFYTTKIVGKILLVLAILCSLSRIYCGVHYPFDIAGSIIVAGLSSLIIYNLREKLIYINEKLIKIYNLVISKINRL